MIASLRKFSTSIYAKILLVIIIIPFVFWGMGSSFKGGSKNIIVKIEKDKYSIEEFGNFIQKFAKINNIKVEANQIEELLSAFIGEKLMDKEVDYFNIKLSDNSLAKLIKHQKNFKRNNEFSRIEYEKFLIKNDITAVNFENNLSKFEARKQLMDFIGEGIIPSQFQVNETFNKINQKRNIELINLNNIFNKKIEFSNDEIQSYFQNNKKNYIETHTSAKILELNPKKLTNMDEFSNLFFERIDEIDEILIQGENIDYVVQKFNLEKPNTFTFDKSGKEIDSKIIDELPKNLIENILELKNDESTVLLESAEKYFIIEIASIDSVQKVLTDDTVRKDIILNLSKKDKRNFIVNIINKINNDNFNKSDFDKLSKKENVTIEKISIENQEDDKILKKELINQVYAFPAKKVFLISDIGLTENYLVFIDNIKSVTIEKNSNEYEKYVNLTKNKIAGDLYNTYDSYIKKRYEIDINYQALDTVKNYFN